MSNVLHVYSRRRGPTEKRFYVRWTVLASVVVTMAMVVLPCLADEREVATATDLMNRGQYSEAIKTLESAVERQRDDNSPVELRMLGESYYQLKDYGKARTFYARALPRQTTQKTKIICESRLALVDYRLGDLNSATERIDNFLRKYPDDSRVGNLAIIQMRIAQDSPIPRADKIKKMDEIYKKIMADKDRYGYYNAVLAAQSLGDVYIEAKEQQKAIALFVTAVHEMRGLITGMETKNMAVPTDLAQGVDGMALQIGKFYMEQKQWGEAMKWLHNVSRSEDLVAQAKYMLAQIAYQTQDPKEATVQLSDEVLGRTPEGETKNSMYLLLAFCWRDIPKPNLEKAKELLKKIPEKSASYMQAQQGLAEIYRDQQDGVNAEKHYLVSVKDPRFAAAALFGLGVVMKERAEAIVVYELIEDAKTLPDKKRRQALLIKSGEYFQELINKYPLTDVAKKAKALIDALRSKGVIVATDSSIEAQLAAWEKIAKEKPGSSEAAQALLSLAQHASRPTYDPQTKALTQAPNWAACAKACLPLVQSQKAFTDVTPERWNEMRQRALYLLARAELGSLPAGASTKRLNGNVEPVRMVEGGSGERAITYLTEATRLITDPKTDSARDIEYAMIEAMLKSNVQAVRDAGEKRYAASETQYGSDPVYQQLAIITADWQDDHGFHDTAGRTYRAVAHKSNMDRNQVMQLLHLAGLSYGRGGRKLIERRDKSTSIAFMIQPRSIIRTAADLPVLDTYPAFQVKKRIPWEKEGPSVSAADAIARVSREFEVPFVWASNPAPDSVETALKQKMIPRETIQTWWVTATLATTLSNIVDMKEYDVNFDLGFSGGTPTWMPKVDEGGRESDVRVFEIFSRQRERFPALALPYGSFASVHRGPTMLFGILKRVEEVTGGRVLWSPGLQKDEALSHEFKSFLNTPADKIITCRMALDMAVDAVGLRYQVVARDYSRELLMESIDCFDELRKLGADSVYAEDAMFNIAVNLYILKDYEKMRLLLREYLKTYDNPSFAHYYDACFWLGRLFEIDRKYREAVKYYAMASEEKVVLFKPEGNPPIPTLDEVKSRLSYDTLFTLSRKASGTFTDATLEGDFLRFIRFNANIELGLDPSVQGVSLINRDSFSGVPCIDLIHQVMVNLALDLRTDNGDKAVAEKAYYRMALVYKEDNLMREAIENVQTLLTRFPKSERLFDALKLKLDIQKGLRDYGAVLETLQEIKTRAGDQVEPFRLDYEMGRVNFDLCNYTNSETSFTSAMAGTQDPEEKIKIREALAQTYLQMDHRERDALALYRDNLQSETAPNRRSIYVMSAYWIEFALSKPPRLRKPLPPDEAAFLAGYEKSTEAERAEMNLNDLARATWIYYSQGRADLVESNTVSALEKFDLASESPDSFLAAEALYESAKIHLAANAIPKARECLEQLLFTTKSVEPTVKATYMLAGCLKAAGDSDAAFRRLNELVTRYPASAYAALARQDPLYQEKANVGGVRGP